MNSAVIEQIDRLTPADRRKALALALELDKRERQKAARLTYDSLYGWQHEFVNATAEYHECCLCAANQIGKSRTGTLIDAMHLLGDYPEEWGGHRFDFAPICWALGYSMEKTRDLLQKKLFGELVNQEFQGGLIPKERIANHQMATGTPNAARTVWVHHKSGTKSMIQFWSYTQGQHAIMGDVVDWVHVDEEPKDQTIRPQLLTRTINGDQGKGGRLIYTFTPENGRTELVMQFKDTPSASQFFMQKGWADAPHMTPEKCERLLEQYPGHQKDMRSKGEPMLGHGRIYDIAEEFITCDPIYSIPAHWYVVHGMDFGWDHPQAHIRLLIDRDNDIVYLAKSYKCARVSANDAYGTVKTWGPAPTAWPHDGLQHEKGRDDAVQQKDHYSKAGFNMMPGHSTWPDVNGESGGNSVEQGLYELADRMRNGKFKVFAGQSDFFAEFRQYHRDEKGKIVKVQDDILDAVRYAYMMRRFAQRIGDIGKPMAYTRPQPIKPVGMR